MLTERYIEALLADEDLADQVLGVVGCRADLRRPGGVGVVADLPDRNTRAVGRRMSAFPKSGHSDGQNSQVLNGCFRPLAALSCVGANRTRSHRRRQVGIVVENHIRASIQVIRSRASGGIGVVKS